MICLSLAYTRLDRALERAIEYRHYIDMCELRADYLLPRQTDRVAPSEPPSDPPVDPPAEPPAHPPAASAFTDTDASLVAAIARFPALLRRRADISRTILTVRRECDGGRYGGSEEARQRLLLDILRQDENPPFTYIDLEADIQGGEMERKICALAARRGITVIRSVHQFAPRAIQVEALLEQVTAREHEIGKVAVRVNGLAEVCAVVEQLRSFRATGAPRHGTDTVGAHRAAPLIVIAMGEYGAPLRILAKRLGLFCSYCTPPGEAAVAPGQLTPSALHSAYRYHDITERTALFAIIGNPVAHSKSPQFHNRVFRTHRKDARYLPIRCDSLPAFHRLASLLGLRGFSITIPHKEEIIPLLHRADRDVRLIGACNTVIVKRGAWHGHNTDRYGFEQPLRRASVLLPLRRASALLPLPLTRRPRHADPKRRALVIGAGGVARAVCVSLLERRYHVRIINRSAERARALADELRAAYPPALIHTLPLTPESASEIIAFAPRLVVQTTSVGMEPDLAADPLPFYRFNGTETVYDLIYTPARTALLQRAAQAGCRVISGAEMFTAQAERQAQYFLRQT